MKTDNIFNFSRFGKYLVSDIRRCVANFGISFLVIVLTGLFLYLIVGTMSLVTGEGWMASNALARTIYLLISFAVLIVSMPVKCYGFITDRKAGANWLMLPVSTTEKFVSMLINCLIILPAAFFACTLAIDWLIVVIDPYASMTIPEGFKGLVDMIAAEASQESEVNALISNFMNVNVLLRDTIDDFMMMILVFLLGALFFKTNKAAKTILAWIAAGSILSMILAPIVMMLAGNLEAETINAISSGDLNASIDFANSFIPKLLGIDTLSDTLLLIGTATAIFFRIKTIRH